MNLPPIFKDKKFGDLFESLSQDYKMIPMGLYRARGTK